MRDEWSGLGELPLHRFEARQGWIIVGWRLPAEQ